METVKEYSTVIGDEKTRFDNFEDAARHWDRETNGKPAPLGGIMVQEFANGVMVRDGWVFFIYDNYANNDKGHCVYINPFGA